MLRNLRIRYKGSVLGFLWAFLNPLLTMLVLYVVFSKIIRIKMERYPLFLLSALLPWNCFSLSLTDAAHSIIDNANLVKKVYFSRATLPLSYVLSNFINLLFSLTILLPVLIIFRAQGLKYVYLLPLILLFQLIFTAGLALFISCANVFFRDTSHILNIGLMFWFYLTPVFYPLGMVPPRFYNIYLLNPMALMVNMYRNVLFDGRPPCVVHILAAIIMILATMALGFFIFDRYESSFAKEI